MVGYKEKNFAPFFEYTLLSLYAIIVYFPFLGLYNLAYIRPHLVHVIYSLNIQRLKSFFMVSKQVF